MRFCCFGQSIRRNQCFEIGLPAARRQIDNPIAAHETIARLPTGAERDEFHPLETPENASLRSAAAWYSPARPDRCLVTCGEQLSHRNLRGSARPAELNLPGPGL